MEHAAAVEFVQRWAAAWNSGADQPAAKLGIAPRSRTGSAIARGAPGR